jgi:hypothetical protein
MGRDEARGGGRGRRGWKKLHLGVDRSGVIVAHTLTEATVDDATTAIELIKAVHGGVASVHGGRGLRLDCLLRCRGCPWRDRRGATDQDSEGISTETAVDGSRSHDPEGEEDWTATVEEGIDYHRQARVENAFFRYKSIIGHGLRARSPAGQGTEAILACNILNQMTQHGRPASYAIGS